jgi:hypothetical protein
MAERGSGGGASLSSVKGSMRKGSRAGNPGG